MKVVLCESLNFVFNKQDIDFKSIIKDNYDKV